MRNWFAALPLLALAACGGGGTDAQTAGSVAPPSAGTGTGGTGGGVGTPTPTPTGSTGGSGGGVTGNGSSVTPSTDHFLNVGANTTFNAVGGFHSLLINNQTGGQLYRGNTSTQRAPSGTIAYDPRNGIFTMTLSDTNAGITRDFQFQDPAHRIDFDATRRPELEVPDLDGFNYLSARDGDANGTFFYQRPGSSTNYVSLAGYVRTAIGDPATGQNLYERGAFVFGTPTIQSQVPISGSGTYTGGFVASMVVNPTLDNAARGLDVLQWMFGSTNISVDFAKASVSLGFTGRVGQSYQGQALVNDAALSVPTGATFNAQGTAAIDLVRTGGFTGKFQSANFSWGANKVDLDFQSVNPNNSTAGASTIDGSFYGPNAVNLGGSFRIVGGIPDQRIDLQGAFTGARK